MNDRLDAASVADNAGEYASEVQENVGEKPKETESYQPATSVNGKASIDSSTKLRSEIEALLSEVDRSTL